MVINHQPIGIDHDLYTYKEPQFCGTFWDDTPIIPAMARLFWLVVWNIFYFP